MKILKTMERTVTAGEAAITYTLNIKQVKNINLSVRAGGTVTVSAGPRVPLEAVDAFVREKIPFILQAKERLGKQKKQERAKLCYLSGEEIFYQGRKLQLEVGKADRHRIPEWIAMLQEGKIQSLSRNASGEAIFIEKDRLCLYTQDTADTSYKQKLYETWQKLQAEIVCTRLVKAYYPYFEKMGVSFPAIRIRKMSSRWGSCIPAKQKVTFNSQLIEKPMESIEYVVVHELAHFIHPNHSGAFYGLVAQILPDWKQRKEMLK